VVLSQALKLQPYPLSSLLPFSNAVELLTALNFHTAVRWDLVQKLFHRRIYHHRL